MNFDASLYVNAKVYIHNMLRALVIFIAVKAQQVDVFKREDIEKEILVLFATC